MNPPRPRSPRRHRTASRSLPKRRGRRPIAPASTSTRAAPDWLWHHLTISGPTADVAAFAEAARGPGIIPWRVDHARVEEDIFHWAVGARGGLSIEGCHILARQFRERIEARDEKAAALIGQNRACPFDLHVLLPNPAEILQRGQTDPKVAGLAGAALGVARRAARDCRAAEPIVRPAVARRQCCHLVGVVHARGTAARGGDSIRRPLAHVTVRVDAASGGLTGPGMETATTTATTDEREGEGPTPWLSLEGYHGSLEELLTLARSRRIDLGKVPLLGLVDQLVAAVRDASPATPMGQRGDWVVMASWLVQLRSLLLLPADAPAHQAAEDAADHFRNRLSELGEIQALAAWLDRRPHLGRDVFTRGLSPEEFDLSGEGGPEIDVIEFLWASMALFDDGDPAPDISETYRPRWRDLYSIARRPARGILKRLAGGARRAAARNSSCRRIPRRPGSPPSPRLKLNARPGPKHVHRQPRTGEAGGGGIGAGSDRFTAIHAVRPALMETPT